MKLKYTPITLKDKPFGPEKQLALNMQKFRLHIDGWGIGLGSFLLQENNSKVHTIAYVSRSLAERNHEVSELKALAVVWYFAYLSHLICGHPIKIVTDHNVIRFLKILRNLTGQMELPVIPIYIRVSIDNFAAVTIIGFGFIPIRKCLEATSVRKGLFLSLEY